MNWHVISASIHPFKLTWMMCVAVAINPADPSNAMHIRPIFEQVYQKLDHHRTTITSAEASSFSLLKHDIKSVLMRV
ncbi:hypothetical protein AQUCO_00100137v1 [Aquilegia coerulea]|uniref:hAT-like transposase RNase-H fold domain-containing protein n=1 Tax=Aquilegia coerulea TaxID=218851 RepID=A0A2G5F925_AQUCA|nr:hypothetical protein AQUCO_00100137v1 [Aquilegia coerulea]